MSKKYQLWQTRHMPKKQLIRMHDLKDRTNLPLRTIFEIVLDKGIKSLEQDLDSGNPTSNILLP